MNNYATTTMTCVDRYMNNGLKIKAKAFQYAVYRDGLSDSLYVTVNWHPDTSTTYVLEDILKCTCNGTTYRFARTAGWADPVCVIPYIPESQSPSYTLAPISSSDALYYNNGNRTAYSFSPGNYTTLPSIVLPNYYVKAHDNYTYRWTLTPGDSRKGWVTAMEIQYRNPGIENWDTISVFAGEPYAYWDLTTDGTIAGKESRIALEYRTYPSNWGGEMEDFATLNWIISPSSIDGEPTSFPALGEVISTKIRTGLTNIISWEPFRSDTWTLISYKLEKASSSFSAMPTAFTEIYNGTNTQYIDTTSMQEKRVQYRLCATATLGGSSYTGSYVYSQVYEQPQPGVYVRFDNAWYRADVGKNI